jgi:hypothetical protein
MLEQLGAAIADATAPDYVTIRAIVAAGTERDDRVARLTAMGREFVTDVRRRTRNGGVCALLAEPPSLRERVLESATRQIVVDDGRELVTMQQLSRDSGIPRRTLYNVYAATELDAACRRRRQTIWRARLERVVLAATTDPRRRLFAIVDALDAWAGSDRFRVDLALWPRASITNRSRDDDLREHLAEIDRFAMGLAVAARLASPAAFAAFITVSIAGAAAWYDRRAPARAACSAFVEREIARHR